MFEIFAQAAPKLQAIADSQTQDTAILGEQFYFWTVVLMWLIHVGLHGLRGRGRPSQERDGDGDEEHPDHRRRHADLLLLRLVDLQLRPAGPADRPVTRRDFTAAGVLQARIPWSDNFGPNLTNNIT